jgi:D-alanyl-D-alanine carboxypeptidase (penicillin-binding protein 5/6)
MKNSHFTNVTGLPDAQHYSTAADLALLAAALVRDFPEFYPMYALKEYSYNNRTQTNSNLLLWKDPFVDGIKTGHTEAAGFCMIASARRGERRLIAVVLGAASEAARATEAQKLLNYGFQSHDLVKMYAKDQAVTVLPVWKGGSGEVKAGFTRDFYVSVPKGEAGRLQARLETRQPLIAPVDAGQPVGTLKLVLNGQPYAESPIVALENIGIGNILKRGWDNLRLMLK